MPSKLVRNKIPQIIEAKGEKAKTHVADDTEYWQRLKEKLQEEVEEFLKDENIEEYIDVLEVLEAISTFKNFPKEEITKVKTEKVEKKGSFSERVVLD